MSSILAPQYLSLQGEIILYSRDASGNPATGFWVGDASEASFKLNESKTDYAENFTGNRATGLTLYQNVVSGFDFKALQLNTKLLTEIFRGAEVTQSTTPVTGKTISDLTGTLKVGDRFQLGAEGVSAVTIKDSTGTPKTLTANTNYELDATTGRVKILDATTGGPYVLPLVADFTPGTNNTSIKLLSGTRKEFHLSLVGVNTAVAGSPKGVLDLYRYQFTLPAETAMINSARAEMQISGSVLVDSLKPASGALGQYGRIQGFGITN